jgi:hypothetical protein
MFYVKSEDESTSICEQGGPCSFINYKDGIYDSIFYNPGAKRNNDLNDSSSLIDLFIEGNYAIDKNGNKL